MADCSHTGIQFVRANSFPPLYRNHTWTRHTETNRLLQHSLLKTESMNNLQAYDNVWPFITITCFGTSAPPAGSSYTKLIKHVKIQLIRKCTVVDYFNIWISLWAKSKACSSSPRPLHNAASNECNRWATVYAPVGTIRRSADSKERLIINVNSGCSKPFVQNSLPQSAGCESVWY